MDCLFCKIGNKEIPAEIVYENDHVFAILDIHPVAPGHTMVIPKVHAATLAELPEEEIGPLFSAVKRMLGKLETALHPQGFTIGINSGPVAGQAIDHLHVHILPRFEGDGGGSVHTVVNNPPKEGVQETAARIKAA